MKGLSRGITIIKGQGAYTGDDRYMLYCVISKHQLSPLKNIVKKTDPKAFLTITTVNGVYGHGNSFFSMDHIE